ncbi:MAG: mannose-1-phosphate guanylyltransferase, partial [Chloroflexi bacterium]|nr:mannose-1-phosphate guanylyltransferase [Chloroflexota bacterium]
MASRATVDLQHTYVTILAGGSGTRLWPHSRVQRPKHLLELVGDSSTLQQTVERVLPLIPAERVFVLTGPDHAGMVAAQLPGLPAGHVLIEPSPRGTAPCLGLAAMRLRAMAGSDDAVMVSLHADHAITEPQRFRSALTAAVVAARAGAIATIGVIPTRPDTGFGYIERAELRDEVDGQPIYAVSRFAEKPREELARQFIDSGRYYWNTGYFAWTLGRILGEFRRQLPAMYAQLEQVSGGGEAGAPDAWNAIVRTTIDVGIMEHAENVVVIPADLGWSDIGSWASLLELLPADADGNVLLGDGEFVGLRTRRSLVRSGKRLVAAIGCDEMII